MKWNLRPHNSSRHQDYCQHQQERPSTFPFAFTFYPLVQLPVAGTSTPFPARCRPNASIQPLPYPLFRIPLPLQYYPNLPPSLSTITPYHPWSRLVSSRHVTSRKTTSTHEPPHNTARV